MTNNYVEINKIAQTDKYSTYNVFFGPNHPGMHGNFGYVLEVVGTRIASVRFNAGLLHRGFEKLMESKLWFQNISLIPRICVVDPDPNEVAYCTSIEKLCGIEIPEKAKYLRTITLEMSRICSLLMGVGALSAMMGLYSAMYRIMNERDMFLDLFEWLTGARIYHIYNVPGGVRRDIPEQAWIDRLNYVLNFLEDCLPEYDKLIFQNPVIHKRLTNFARVSGDEAINYGLTGPNLRACGVDVDYRRLEPYAAYPYIDYEIPLTGTGDAISRAVQVRLEIEVTIDIIRKAIKQMPQKGDVRVKTGNTLKFKVPAGEVYTAVESSKGEFGYMIVSDGGLKPYRVEVRGPSLPAGIALARKQLLGMKIDDVAIWMASYAVCPPDIDK